MKGLTVVIDRKKLVARMESNTIRIERPGGQPQRIPLNMVDSVIVVGSPMVSCDVWRALANRNIPAMLIPSRGGGTSAYIGSGLSSTVNKRLAQYEGVQSRKCSLAIGRWLLSLKIKGQESVLKMLGSGKSETEISCGRIEERRINLDGANCRSSLMGFEGAAASEYFKSLGVLLSDKWKFSGRNRRPPKDPINTLLSLSYIMAGGEVLRVVQSKGLDPSIGFLHSQQPGRDSLVLDILEPIRPKVDKFVLNLLDKQLKLAHFTTNKQDGCLLNKEGRKIYYKAWSLCQKCCEDNKSLKSIVDNIVNKLINFLPDFKSPWTQFQNVNMNENEFDSNDSDLHLCS